MRFHQKSLSTSRGGRSFESFAHACECCWAFRLDIANALQNIFLDRAEIWHTALEHRSKEQDKKQRPEDSRKSEFR